MTLALCSGPAPVTLGLGLLQLHRHDAPAPASASLWSGTMEIGLGRGFPNIPWALARERRGNLPVFLIVLKHSGSLSSSLHIIMMLGGTAHHALVDEYCPWLFYQCLEEQHEMLKEGHSADRVWGALDSRGARRWKGGAKRDTQISSQLSWARTGLCSHSTAPLTALSRSCLDPHSHLPPFLPVTHPSMQLESTRSSRFWQTSLGGLRSGCSRGRGD